MYGRVSYKKQFVLGILLLIVLLGAIELFTNIWLYNYYRCEFEDNEIFKNTDPVANRKLCLQSLGYEVWWEAEGEQDFTNEKIYAVNGTLWGKRMDLVYFNEYGLRGPEITKEKPDNTYRIFAIGASTTFGSGVFDTQTYPFYLQLMYDEIDLDFDIEVINAGWPGTWSLEEADAIKEKYIDFEPNLFIIYDGAGEMVKGRDKNDPRATATNWKETWIDICELGKKYDYETIITLQPFVATGNKTLTTNEQRFAKNAIEKFHWTDNYPAYAEQLKEINNHCTLTVDLRELFDDYKEPIFYDRSHTGYRGNQIIAEKMFELSLPIVMEKAEKVDFISANKNPIENFDDPPIEKLLEIKGDPLLTSPTNYKIIVSGEISLGPRANQNADILSPNGTTVDGRISPTGLDNYFFTGNIVSITADQHVFSFIDGELFQDISDEDLEFFEQAEELFDETLDSIKIVISPYKTPKVFSLIFK